MHLPSIIDDRAIDAAHLVAAIADEFLYACLLLMLGETNEYEQFCRELVDRPGQPADDYGAVVLARVCAVGSSNAVAPARLVNWATAGVGRFADAARLHVLGLAYYRAGRYLRAIETLQQSNAGRGWSPHAKSQNWLVLAMARFRLGEAEEARHCLETARSLIAQVRPKNSDEPALLKTPPGTGSFLRSLRSKNVPVPFSEAGFSTDPDEPSLKDSPDWIEINVLLREAEALLHCQQ
jgi:tetratricopeptide (TPR) repeat protein